MNTSGIITTTATTTVVNSDATDARILPRSFRLSGFATIARTVAQRMTSRNGWTIIHVSKSVRAAKASSEIQRRDSRSIGRVVQRLLEVLAMAIEARDVESRG